MSDVFKIADFLEPVNISFISQDREYHDGQLGNLISIHGEEIPDIMQADIILIGCPEQRGAGPSKNANAPDHVRQEFYNLYHWHYGLTIIDAGNIKIGATLNDTYAAVKTVISEITQLGKTALIIGGSHDLTLAQYYSYGGREKLIEATCVDARIDLNMNSPANSDHFLMEMLTGEPNFIRHYNHIGFQSFYVHPYMLETLDKLRFDCYRVGKVRDNIEEMEPVIRHSDMFSFDISAIANAYAPANKLPNGFTGDEACALMRYAGMSAVTSSVGIYGYEVDKDQDHLTAKQVSQMLWYFLEGRSRGNREARMHEKEGFNEFHTAFAEVATTFLQSKRTGRWWMQLPDQQYIPCSYNDYIQASSNEVPERWLRAQERNV
ncbi:MAG: formimidoylglutamase [Flavitalea sp.]